MESATVVILFRLVHILVGVFWVGSALFISTFLLPSLRVIGPAGAPIMEQIAQVRRLPMYMMAATILTILSGLGLYWRDSDGFQSAWMHSGPGRVFGIGAAFGILATVVGMAVNAPTGKRMGAIGAAIRARGGSPTAAEIADMQRLERRMTGAANIVAVLVVLATGAMAVARYVP